MSRLLVVDDSSTMRRIVISTVKQAGFEAEFFEANDGCEALEVLGKEQPIDLIITDVNMPKMNGLELVRCIRDQEARGGASGRKGKLPILMVTTEVGANLVQEALSAGANDYLKKPFTAAQMKEKIGPLVGS